MADIQTFEKVFSLQNAVSSLGQPQFWMYTKKVDSKKEVHPDNYEYFFIGLKSLTGTEREIYDIYLSGKTAKEIAEIKGVKERTIKVHNHNIYEKLGVSSRKQLLRFAALAEKETGGHKGMTLADRLNQIIREQKISKLEFAKRLGVTKNYILTGDEPSRRGLNKTISPALAKLIALEFGYDENWILNGDGKEYTKGNIFRKDRICPLSVGSVNRRRETGFNFELPDKVKYIGISAHRSNFFYW